MPSDVVLVAEMTRLWSQAAGVAEGSLKPDIDPQAAAQVILSLAVGLFLQGVLDPRGADWQKVAEQSIGIILNGMPSRVEGVFS